jgi:hypothetical protein
MKFVNILCSLICATTMSSTICMLRQFGGNPNVRSPLMNLRRCSTNPQFTLLSQKVDNHGRILQTLIPRLYGIEQVLKLTENDYGRKVQISTSTPSVSLSKNYEEIEGIHPITTSVKLLE